MNRRAVCLLSVLLVAATWAPAAAQPAPSATTPAFERLSECARDSGRLLVLLLIDESGSLGRTDPQALRVPAAQAAVRSLAGLGDEPDVTVEVAVAAFSVDFEITTGWTRADASTVDPLVDGIEEFRGRDSGLDTDFANALIGANDALSLHAAETSQAQGTPCKLLLLFTDGDFDIEPRTTPARREQGLEKSYAPGVRLDEPGGPERAMDIGRRLLCDAGELVDGMRDEDIVIVTIALEEEISPEQQQFLHAVSTGGTADVGCGERRGDDLGAYVPATDLGELFAGFTDAVKQIEGFIPHPDGGALPVCQRERCPEGRRTFDLSPAFEEFHLLANIAAQPVIIELTSPETDDVLVLESGTNGRFTLGNVELDVVWLSPIDVAIDGRLPGGEDGWVGTWTLTFVDPTAQNPDAVASAQLYLFGGLTPELVEDPQLRRGEEGLIAVRVVDAAGTPRTPTDFVQEALVDVSVTDPVTGRTQALAVEGPDGQGRYLATWTAPVEMDAAAVNVGVRLAVVAQTGIALQPRVRTYAVAVEPPVTYPSVGPVALRLSGISGTTGEASGTLVIAGGTEGGGCVWFTGLTITRIPRHAEGVAGSYAPPAVDQASCIAVGAGEEREVEVTVTAERVASGTVEGRVQARLASDADPEVLPTELLLSFEMHRPVDQGVRLWLFLALLLPGLLLPLLVLWLLNWLGARFEPAARLRTALISVHVPPGGSLLRHEDGQDHRLFLNPEDFANAPGAWTPVREFTVPGLELRAKVPWFPFRAPYGVARADVPAVGPLGREGTRPFAARVPFNLARQWVFLLDRWEIPAAEGDDASEAAAPDVYGRLRVWVPGGALEDHAEDVIDTINLGVPAAAQRLAADVAALAASEQPPDDDIPPRVPPEADVPPGWTPPERRRSTNHGDRGPTAPDPWGTPRPQGAATQQERSVSSPETSSDADKPSPQTWTPPPR